MGSELSTIRSLLENQIDSGETSTSSDPSSAILNTYINQSIRKIVRKDRPHELYSATVSSVNINADSNTVSPKASLTKNLPSISILQAMFLS